jgi:hypothetical protein
MRDASLTGTEHLARGVGAALAAVGGVFHDFRPIPPGRGRGTPFG